MLVSLLLPLIGIPFTDNPLSHVLVRNHLLKGHIKVRDGDISP